MKYLLILFVFHAWGGTIDPKFYENRRKVRILTDYLDSIHSRYWNIFKKIANTDEEFREILSQYDFILKVQQKYASECNQEQKFECENIFFELMDSLENLYQSFTKLENRKQYLEFLTLKALMKIQMHFVDNQVKKKSQSVRERYKLDEELKNYTRDFFIEVNKGFPTNLKTPNYDFWKNFILQSHFVLAKLSNLQFFPKNFSLMNKSMYGLIYSIQNTDKTDKSLANDVQAMNSQWNFIQKNLFIYEKK